MPSFNPLFRSIGCAPATLALGAAVAICSCSGPSAPASKVSQVISVKQTPKVNSAIKLAKIGSSASIPTFVHPAIVKGIYLTAWSAASPAKMVKMMKFIHDTELNSVVIDVRDSGDMYFPTHIKLADEVEGKRNLAVTHPEKLMKMLAANHIWPIARIACFRDQYVPVKFPDRAVQTASGQPWHDKSKHYWLDPYDKRNWEYIGQTVDYALSIGFPEIQLDYVRFPSEGKSSTQRFPNEKKFSNPVTSHQDVIAEFAKYIRAKVKAQHGYFSSDLFGIISSSKSDQGIGQELEKVAEPFDAISPMIYPSHFAKGEYGIPNPNLAPYAIITKSLHDFRRRLPHAEVRPWLQDFSLFGVHYGAAQVRQQLKALNDQGYKEFLLWNAGNRYTPGGPRTKKEAEAAEAKIVIPKSAALVSSPSKPPVAHPDSAKASALAAHP
jgi:hypothetical protein